MTAERQFFSKKRKIFDIIQINCMQYYCKQGKGVLYYVQLSHRSDTGGNYEEDYKHDPSPLPICRY